MLARTAAARSLLRVQPGTALRPPPIAPFATHGPGNSSRRRRKPSNYGKKFRRHKGSGGGRQPNVAATSFANGIMAVHKPRGWTSADVTHRIRGVLQRRYRELTGEYSRIKVGHGGTLDPDATGVLVVVAIVLDRTCATSGHTTRFGLTYAGVTTGLAFATYFTTGLLLALNCRS